MIEVGSALSVGIVHVWERSYVMDYRDKRSHFGAATGRHERHSSPHAPRGGRNVVIRGCGVRQLMEQMLQEAPDQTPHDRGKVTLLR